VVHTELESAALDALLALAHLHGPACRGQGSTALRVRGRPRGPGPAREEGPWRCAPRPGTGPSWEVPPKAGLQAAEGPQAAEASQAATEGRGRGRVGPGGSPHLAQHGAAVPALATRRRALEVTTDDDGAGAHGGGGAAWGVRGEESARNCVNLLVGLAVWEAGARGWPRPSLAPPCLMELVCRHGRAPEQRSTADGGTEGRQATAPATQGEGESGRGRRTLAWCRRVQAERLPFEAEVEGAPLRNSEGRGLTLRRK